MSLRRDALAWADEILRSVIRDAIEYRRAHPHRFALFHSRMVELLRSSGLKPRNPRVKWHAYWAARYSAKAYALDADLVERCIACVDRKGL